MYVPTPAVVIGGQNDLIIVSRWCRLSYSKYILIY